MLAPMPRLVGCRPDPIDRVHAKNCTTGAAVSRAIFT
jgi:hypothetical protein